MTVAGLTLRTEDFFGASSSDGLRRWALVGPRHAVAIGAVVMPAGYVPTVRSVYVRDADGRWLIPSDMSWHSADPVLEGASQSTSCDLVPGRCWFDGSSYGADRALRSWAERGHGEDRMRDMLEAMYLARFGAPT